MSLRDSYKHLLGIPYSSGDADCYGLVMRYYHDVYGIQLANVARPEHWWSEPDLDIIPPMVSLDGWQNVSVNPRQLKIGDGLIFSLVGGKANHVGCYVGNGMFIHHVFGRFSAEEALVDKWTNRLLMVVRHPGVEEMGKDMVATTDIMDLLPEHIRAKIIRVPQP